MNDTVHEAQAFLAENWNSSNDLAAWRELVVDSQWAALRWPTEWFGRGLDDDSIGINLGGSTFQNELACSWVAIEFF